jgi:Glycosyltransferase Family 4
MRIAVFTDVDFDRASSVTTALGALLRYAPPAVRPRIYTFSDLEVDEPSYLALRSPAVPLPVGAAPLYLPRLRELERRLRSDDVRVIHLTTPGPAGVAARVLANRVRLPLVGSLHGSALPESGGRAHAGPVVSRYLRWLYGGCTKVLVPSRCPVPIATTTGTGGAERWFARTTSRSRRGRRSS